MSSVNCNKVAVWSALAVLPVAYATLVSEVPEAVSHVKSLYPLVKPNDQGEVCEQKQAGLAWTPGYRLASDGKRTTCCGPYCASWQIIPGGGRMKCDLWRYDKELESHKWTFDTTKTCNFQLSTQQLQQAVDFWYFHRKHKTFDNNEGLFFQPDTDPWETEISWPNQVKEDGGQTRSINCPVGFTSDYFSVAKTGDWGFVGSCYHNYASGFRCVRENKKFKYYHSLQGSHAWYANDPTLLKDDIYETDCRVPKIDCALDKLTFDHLESLVVKRMEDAFRTLSDDGYMEYLSKKEAGLASGRGAYQRANEYWESKLKNNETIIKKAHGRQYTGDFEGLLPFWGISIENWDVSQVDNMSGLFKNMPGIVADLSKWDVGSVKDFDEMFWGTCVDPKYLKDKDQVPECSSWGPHEGMDAMLNNWQPTLHDMATYTNMFSGFENSAAHEKRLDFGMMRGSSNKEAYKKYGEDGSSETTNKHDGSSNKEADKKYDELEKEDKRLNKLVEDLIKQVKQLLVQTSQPTASLSAGVAPSSQTSQPPAPPVVQDEEPAATEKADEDGETDEACGQKVVGTDAMTQKPSQDFAACKALCQSSQFPGCVLYSFHNVSKNCKLFRKDQGEIVPDVKFCAGNLESKLLRS